MNTKRQKELKSGLVSPWLIVAGLVVAVAVGWFAWSYFGDRESEKLLERIPVLETDRLSERARKMMKSCEESIRVNPKDASAWGLLGRACLAHQLSEPARECFEVAALLEPENFEWFYSQALTFDNDDNQAAIPLIKTAIELCERGKDHLQCKLAEIYFDESELEACGELVDAVLEVNPKQLRASQLKARLLLIENQPKESLRFAQAVVDALPERQEALRLLAQIHSRLGNSTEANRYAALAEQPNAFNASWPDPTFQKVLDLRKDVNKLVANALKLPPSMIKDRVRVLREAVKEEPHEPNWHGFLGQTYLQMRQFARAKEVLENGVKLHPDSPVLRYTLGLVYLNQGNYQKAIPVLEKAVSLKKDYDLAYLNLGIAYRQNGQLDKSIQAIQESISILPGVLKSQLNLAVSLEMDNQFDAAEKAYRECLKLDEQSAEVNFLLGKLLSQKPARREEARQYLNSALKLQPGLEEAQKLLESLK